jgi:DNA-binding SARP family transcriptional activator
VLLVQRGRIVPKHEIAEFVWGDALPRNVAATLETYVSVVRARLGPERRLVATEVGGYRFDAGGAGFDVDEFDGLLREAAGAPAELRRERLSAGVQIQLVQARSCSKPPRYEGQSLRPCAGARGVAARSAASFQSSSGA